MEWWGQDLIQAPKFSKAAQNNCNKFTISKGVESDYIDNVFKSNFNIKYRSNIYKNNDRKINISAIDDGINVGNKSNSFSVKAEINGGNINIKISQG